MVGLVQLWFCFCSVWFNFGWRFLAKVGVVELGSGWLQCRVVASWFCFNHGGVGLGLCGVQLVWFGVFLSNPKSGSHSGT